MQVLNFRIISLQDFNVDCKFLSFDVFYFYNTSKKESNFFLKYNLLSKEDTASYSSLKIGNVLYILKLIFFFKILKDWKFYLIKKIIFQKF